jgi:hypothetical protein
MSEGSVGVFQASQVSEAEQKHGAARAGDYGVTFITDDVDDETQYGKSKNNFGAGDISNRVNGAIIVPRMSPKGGIRGSGNKYGCVVEGNIIGLEGKVHGSNEVNPRLKGNKQAAPVEDEQTEDEAMAELEKVAGEIEDNNVPVEEYEDEYEEYEEEYEYEDEEYDDEPAHNPGLTKEDILDIMDERDRRAAQKEKRKKKMTATPKPQPVSQKRTRVRLQGNFGTYTGKYLHVVVNSGIVGLVTNEDDDSFCPPMSKNAFTISCEGQEYVVYFAGIVIDLDFCGKTMQLFHRIAQK